ncbi:MAG: toprim domain-containing protein [Acetobacteraceae bacterium]|nr:toprim domain-containing protein [Acetobacteraceae bacterium]
MSLALRFGVIVGLSMVMLGPYIGGRGAIGTRAGGCAVRLAPIAETLLVGGGVFTALAAGDRFALPAWALMSTRNLRVWRVPEGVRDVLIAAATARPRPGACARG